MITAWPGIYRLTREELDALIAATPASWDVDALLGFISTESGFKIDAHNPNSSATGLIQMVDATARAISGVPSSAIARQTVTEQIPGIIKFFKVGKVLEGADFKVLGLSGRPDLVHASDDTVLYPASSEAAKNHPTFRDASGAITVGKVRDWWNAYANKHTDTLDPNKLAKTPQRPGGGGMFWALFGSLLGGVAIYSIRKG